MIDFQTRTAPTPATGEWRIADHGSLNTVVNSFAVRTLQLSGFRIKILERQNRR